MAAALDDGSLDAPQDVHDARAWDAYWNNHLKVGAFETAFNDSMASDRGLPGLLTRRGARTILCVGNGLSFDATALALHGFDVTALDLSAVPAEVFARKRVDPEHPMHRIPGFAAREDGSVAFGHPGLIPPELCPKMHRSDDHPPRGGGSLAFVTGDLTNPEVCPGPFDVVIERRTLQLFPEAERIVALERLVARLGNRGTIVSHHHMGGWRPGDSRTHFASEPLLARGFVFASAATPGDCESAARFARLMFSTG
jgi:hypothetical protein